MLGHNHEDFCLYDAFPASMMPSRDTLSCRAIRDNAITEGMSSSTCLVCPYLFCCCSVKASTPVSNLPEVSAKSPDAELASNTEELCRKRALETFKVNPEEWGVNVQPLSGSPANFQVFLPKAMHFTHAATKTNARAGYLLPFKSQSKNARG